MDVAPDRVNDKFAVTETTPLNRRRVYRAGYTKNENDRLSSNGTTKKT